MYVAAASFWLLGLNTTAARIPFALFGLASIWLGVRLVKRWTSDPWIAHTTALLLTTCVPFLLHMRQCRYYAPTVFFTLWVAWAYWRFLHHRRWSTVELLLAFLFLFHSDYGVLIPVALACGIHFTLSRPTASGWRRAGTVAFLVLALTVPWMIFFKFWQHQQPFSWKGASHHMQFYFRQTNRYLVPLGFWALACLIGRPSPATLFGPTGSSVRSAWRLVGLLLEVGFLFLVFVPKERHFRYLIFLVPFLLMAEASLLVWLFRRRWGVGLGITALLVFTDLIPYSGPSILAAQIPSVKARLSTPDVKVRSLLLEFLGELTHPYRGPVDGVVELLLTQAKPGQTVKTPYEEHPILFYTNLTVERLAHIQDFARESFPDWIILRRIWLPDRFFESLYYRKIRESYREVLLDAPDIPWQNRPDPGYHRFKTDRQAPPLIVFQKQ